MKMQKRQLLSMIAIFPLTGCLSTVRESFTDGGENESRGFALIALETDDAPDDAPVTPHDDERIADVGPVQEVLERAAKDGQADVFVPSDEAADVKERIEDLPTHGRDTLVEYEASVFRLDIVFPSS